MRKVAGNREFQDSPQSSSCSRLQVILPGLIFPAFQAASKLEKQKEVVSTENVIQWPLLHCDEPTLFIG
jgi:hypothetical protein